MDDTFPAGFSTSIILGVVVFWPRKQAANSSFSLAHLQPDKIVQHGEIGC